MIQEEKEIFDFLNSFRTSKDSNLLTLDYTANNYDKDDITSLSDLEYLELVRYYNRLLNIKDSLNYRIEIGPNCTFLIERLFERYVSNNTFVLTTEQEHPAVKNCLRENTYIIKVDELYRKNAISQIIKKYKQSKCINFFLIMQGVICGSAEIIDEAFFKKLKAALQKEGIPHILILDDCQGLYMTNRDYTDFDGILATGHVLIKHGIEMGILYTKLNKKIGYINKAGLKAFSTKLAFVLNHRKDAIKFNSLIKDYLKDEIDKKDLKIKPNQASHMLVIQTNGIKFNQKHADEMEKSYITFSELNTRLGLIRLRYQEAITIDPIKYINSLKRLKKILRSLRKKKELGNEATFDNSIALNYDYSLNNKDERMVSDVNSKSNYNSSFNMKETESKEKVYPIKFHYIFFQRQR